MRDDHERLLDILEAIEKIEKRAPSNRDAFDADEMVQTWVLHHLQVLGEAARALSEDFRAAHADFPWKGIVGMRNILVHHYFEIDTDLVWSAVQTHLPDLKVKVLEALDV